MSDMLEQAIIDAEALKEAATKNAETLVLEKYSNQIKEAVDFLLEQDEPVPGLETELTAAAADAAPTPDAEPAPVKSTVMQDIPLAATSDDDQPIEISLDKLVKEINNLSEAMSFAGPFDSLDDHDPLEEYMYEDDDNPTVEPAATDGSKILHGGLERVEEEYDIEELEELEEPLMDEYAFTEEDDLYEEIAEALLVDVYPQKSGWQGTSEALVDLAEEEILALEQDSEVREKRQAMRDAAKQLQEANKRLVGERKDLQKSLKEAANYVVKLRDAVVVLDKKLAESSLKNAKLLYQNKALSSDSLNERQKQNLAEAIINADSIEEAKVIFETLQSTVGGTSRIKQPKSLSEAVQKTSSIILSTRNKDYKDPGRQKQNPTIDRWRTLAGIDK